MTALFPQFKTLSGLQASSLSLSRGQNALFEGLSVTLKSSETLWIQGSNGIGKTTLLEALSGLTRPDDGMMAWHEGETAIQPSRVIAYQPHNSYAKASLTAEEDLAFWAKLYGTTDIISAALEHVGLSDRREVPAQNLSAGQRKRLALAKMILSQKPIWVMDEPGAAMDTAGLALIDETIHQHIMRGGSVIIASHHKARNLGGQARILTLEAQS